LHAIEAAELVAHHREQLDAGVARMLVALLDRVLAPDLALRALAVGSGAAALAGEEEQVAGAHRVDVVRHRRRHRGQLQAELFQALFRTHARCSALMLRGSGWCPWGRDRQALRRSPRAWAQ